MSYDYTPMKEKAEELIGRFGTFIQIERKGSDADWTKKYDPATMRSYWEDSERNIVYEAPEDTVSTWDGKAVLSNWPKTMLDNRVVETSDIRMIVVSDVEVKSGDLIITASGRSLNVVPPTRLISPNGKDLIVQEVNSRE
jgi:hypothetical protein